MYAALWTDWLNKIRQELDELCGRRCVDDRTDIWSSVSAINTALVELGDLAVSMGSPPRPDIAPTVTADSAVKQILSAQIRGVTPDEVDEDALDRARRSGRCNEPTAGRLLPLERDGPTVQNWYVLLPVVSQQFREFAETSTRIEKRFDGHDTAYISTTIAEIADSFILFAGVLEQIATQMLWLFPVDGRIDIDHAHIESMVTDVLEATDQ